MKPAGKIPQNTRRGIWLMIVTTFCFACQDALSRHLAGEYNVFMIVMIRYWFFAAFVIALAMRAPGGLAAATRSHYPVLQIARGLLLATEICVMVASLVLLGLVESHAVFVSFPLMVAALSGPVLGEKVGWRRWLAIGVGFIGVLIILRPGHAVFTPLALIPFAAALLFALYSLFTRYVAQKDAAAVSFFWTGTVGALAMTGLGLWYWEPMTAPDWGWMLLLSGLAVLGHWLLIKAYEVAEASDVQPFTYFQLVFASIFGITLFGEALRWNVALGAGIVVAAGLFALWRQRVRARGG
jgi:drug/metabolite transporter (DMT)-like permease